MYFYVLNYYYYYHLFALLSYTLQFVIEQLSVYLLLTSELWYHTLVTVQALKKKIIHINDGEQVKQH